MKYIFFCHYLWRKNSVSYALLLLETANRWFHFANLIEGYKMSRHFIYYDYLANVIDKITSLRYSCYPKASYTHRNRFKKDGDSVCIKCDKIFYLEKRTRRRRSCITRFWRFSSKLLNLSIFVWVNTRWGRMILLILACTDLTTYFAQVLIVT